MLVGTCRSRVIPFDALSAALASHRLSIENRRHAMGMGPAGVFIVESPGVQEMAGGYAEAPIVTEMLKLIQIPCVSRRSESRDDLERDAKIYRQRRFDVLLFSAHGSPGEIALTTGE